MKRSKFNLGHYKLLTCKMGQLVPVTWFETLPGDTIEHATSALVRCAPLATPVMHPIQVRFHHFFVPNRLLWASSAGDDWQSFITGGSDGLNAAVPPYVTITGNVGMSTLHDYLGCATAGFSANYRVSALPYRAYQLIWNEFYRDQDLQTAAVVALAGGSDGGTTLTLQNISWEKDYLTTSRPWAFKGSSIALPLGTTAPVKGIGISASDTTAARSGQSTWQAGDTGGAVNRTVWDTTQSGQSFFITAQSAAAVGTGNLPQIYADLSTATAVDINTVRHAFALQRFEEARARYGSRYTEYLRYLGVRSSDARLQRPEYLGGSKQIIQFSEVLQTAPTSAGTAGGAGGVGQFGGHGITSVRGNFYRRFFEEHGIVVTMMSVRPRTMYSQRLARQFVRGQSGYQSQLASKEDWWQRELQHIGQQKVDGSEADLQAVNTIFGYQDRYDEYRRFESSVNGLFRSTLDTWHLSREFGGAASLNSSFVSCVPSTRIFADTSNDNLYVMAHHSIQARRLVSKEGNSLTF